MIVDDCNTDGSTCVIADNRLTADTVAELCSQLTGIPSPAYFIAFTASHTSHGSKCQILRRQGRVNDASKNSENLSIPWCSAVSGYRPIYEIIH